MMERGVGNCVRLVLVMLVQRLDVHEVTWGSNGELVRKWSQVVA